MFGSKKLSGSAIQSQVTTTSPYTSTPGSSYTSSPHHEDLKLIIPPHTQHISYPTSPATPYTSSPTLSFENSGLPRQLCEDYIEFRKCYAKEPELKAYLTSLRGQQETLCADLKVGNPAEAFLELKELLTQYQQKRDVYRLMASSPLPEARAKLLKKQKVEAFFEIQKKIVQVEKEINKTYRWAKSIVNSLVYEADRVSKILREGAKSPSVQNSTPYFPFAQSVLKQLENFPELDIVEALVKIPSGFKPKLMVPNEPLSPSPQRDIQISKGGLFFRGEHNKSDAKRGLLRAQFNTSEPALILHELVGEDAKALAQAYHHDAGALQQHKNIINQNRNNLVKTKSMPTFQFSPPSVSNASPKKLPATKTAKIVKR